jgi:hypothetical protein
VTEPASDLTAALAEERWSFPWRIGATRIASCADPEARLLAATRVAMLAEPIEAAVTGRQEAAALVVGDGEGRLAQSLLELGISRVLCVDGDEAAIRRGELMRRASGIPPQTLELRIGTGPGALEKAGSEPIAVAIFAGIVAPVDDPGTLARLAAGHAERLAAFELDGSPDRRLENALQSAGFERIGIRRPPADGAPAFVLRERNLVLAQPGDHS